MVRGVKPGQELSIQVDSSLGCGYAHVCVCLCVSVCKVHTKTYTKKGVFLQAKNAITFSMNEAANH